mgnify:CR=1 FL=1
MHVAVFYQHYHTPDCPTAARPYALVQALAARHRVTLIATDAWRPQRITHDFAWIPPGVEAHWLGVPYANAMGPGRRLRSYLQYALCALLQSRRVDRPDVVFGSSTPLTAALAAALAARRWGVPWVFEVRDLWPDFPIEMGAVQSPRLQHLLYEIERWLYRSAARIVTASPDQTAHVHAQVARPEKVSTVEYGTELDLVAAIREENLDALRARLAPNGQRIVLYAGSFGRANAIPTLVDTAARLESRADVCFVFAGDGFYAPLLRRAAERLPNVRLLPPQPRRRALALFCLADLTLVPFIDLPVLATNGPSKLYDSLAAGTPVVVTNPGWTKRLVETHGCGWFVPAACPDRLAACIATLADAPDRLQRAGARAAAHARRRFDLAAHMARPRAIVEAAASHP